MRLLSIKNQIEFWNRLQFVQVRDYSEADFNAIKEISKHIWGGHDYLPHLINKYLKDPHSRPRVLIDETGVVGVANTRRITHEISWLEAMRTHPNARGKGYATILTKDQILQAKELGTVKCWLMTSVENQATRQILNKLDFIENDIFYLWGYSRELPEYKKDYELSNQNQGLDSLGQLMNLDHLHLYLNDEEEKLGDDIKLVQSFETVIRISNQIKKMSLFSLILGEYEVLPIDRKLISNLISTKSLFYISETPSLINVSYGKDGDEELFLGVSTIDSNVLLSILDHFHKQYNDKKIRMFYSTKLSHKLLDIPEWQFRHMELDIST